MRCVRRATIAGFGSAIAACALAAVVSAQAPGRLPLPLQPFGESGEAIWPAYEGWGATADDSAYMLVLGYLNRNRSQVLEIPIGPNNRIEPGGPDYGQPTVFEPGLQHTWFAIRVPKDFGNKKLTWTLVANGQTSVITFDMHPDYHFDFFKDGANGNEPPRMKLSANEPMFAGPTVGFSQTLTGSVGQPMPLKVWASDMPAIEGDYESQVVQKTRGGGATPPPFPRNQVAMINGQVIAGRTARPSATGGVRGDIVVAWQKLRGPGKVTFNPPRVGLNTNRNKDTVVEAAATATFSAPGEYWLRVQPIESENPDGLCCFTFAILKVTIK